MPDRQSQGPGLDPANESPFKGNTGLRRILNAFGYSLAALLIPLALLLPVPWLGRGLMIGSVLLVLVVELLNSAIEAVVDRVSLENHRLAKRAKDIGSAAVFVALINTFAVWACVGMAAV